jgi:hypothetical protein
MAFVPFNLSKLTGATVLHGIHKTVTNDFSTAVVAASAISSPNWLPSLSTISEQASLLLPILGVLLVLVQIFVYLKYKKG